MTKVVLSVTASLGLDDELYVRRIVKAAWASKNLMRESTQTLTVVESQQMAFYDYNRSEAAKEVASAFKRADRRIKSARVIFPGGTPLRVKTLRVVLCY